jgi:hypothetical protein
MAPFWGFPWETTFLLKSWYFPEPPVMHGKEAAGAKRFLYILLMWSDSAM